MKKLALVCLSLLVVASLAACSAENDNTDNTANTVASSSTPQKDTPEKTNYDAVISEIKSTLDPDNTGSVTIEVKNDIVDSDFPEPHDVIEVNATGDSKKALEELMNAYYSNTLTPEQDTALMLFRSMISGLAKELPKETTTISFGYEVGYNERQLVALSSKDKDLIPID